jgi:ankyrin repeat protein
MNWLLFTSQKFDKFDKIERLLIENNGKCTIINLEDVASDTVDSSLFASLNHTSYAIFNLPSEFMNHKSFLFALGFIIGKEIPVFISKNIIKSEFVLDLLNDEFVTDFSNLENLYNILEKNLPNYIKLEKKKNALKVLFEKGIPFTPDCFSSYIARDKLDICKLFYEAGMSVDVRDAAGTPMICIAARSGRKEIIEWLVEQGAEINAISKDRGYSPVMDAVWKSSLDVVELLIKLGADLNIVSNDGQTALIIATGASNPRICELLVKNGADPNFKDRMGMSSLEYAILFKKQILIPIYEEYAK